MKGSSMKSTCPAPERRIKVAAVSVTPDRILDAPLNDLLTETGVEIFDSSIADRSFFGAVVQRKSGETYLAMPAGRSELEHDTMARYLIAQAFDVDLPELPPPFVTSEI
jgi:hypothetical protein